MKVGIFDSGIGGLTVLKTLLEKRPNNEYIYYGDTLNLPYGDKTKEELLKLAENDIEFLLEKNVDIIVIACGTISANCIHHLKNKYNIPIYDIINPTIEYINNSNYQNIGVIATNRTIDSHIFKKNINKNIIEIPTPKFVPLIENNNHLELEKVIKEYLSDYQNKIDALVLGCTHYPIIKENIKKHLNKDTDILDMSTYIIDKIEEGSTKSIKIYYSKLNETTKNNTKRILNGNNLVIEENSTK